MGVPGVKSSDLNRAAKENQKLTRVQILSYFMITQLNNHGLLMPRPRQRPIAVTSAERDRLDAAKSSFEQATGDAGDWGKFLGTISLLGLAAVGVYALGKAAERSPQSVDVTCHACRGVFLMAVPNGTPSAVLTVCPNCGREVVVDLGNNIIGELI